MASMLSGMKVTHFGCVESVEMELTPLHAFIGPNDSGKSTLLRAVQWGCWPFNDPKVNDSRRHIFQAPPQAMEGSQVVLSFVDGGSATTALRDSMTEGSGRQGLPMPLLLRLDPDALRHPASVIPSNEPLAFFDERGTGLAAIYDALQSRNFDAFLELRKQILELFPSMKHVGFPGAPGSLSQRIVTVTLENGTIVPARGLSEGLLYFLALAILPHVDGGAVVLLEEPENGLHPARIADVMKVLREVSKTTQVLIATHSPLVINELQPAEVSVVTRDDNGTRVTPIADTPNFAQRAETFALGELWLAYANGTDESPLIAGTPVL